MTEKRKVTLNLSVSILSQVVMLVLGFVLPRIVLSNYGSDTNGLTNTIGQIFTFIALLESGIGVAARNKLYKPISENDKDGISYWVSVARNYYRKIAVFYLIAVTILAFLTPILLKTEINYWTVFAYILFEGLVNVIPFFYTSSWICFLSAAGENYIISAISFLANILKYGVKMTLLLLNMNIALIQVGYLGVSLFDFVIIRHYIKKHYSWLNYNAASRKTKLPDRNAYIVSEVAWIVFSSTDMIVLSVFISTKLSSVYSVYNMVFVALTRLLNVAYSAINYKLGKAYVTDIESYKTMHDLFNSVFLGAMTILMSTAYVLILPFIKLYTNGVNDVEYIYTSLPLLFCLISMLSCSRYIGGNLSGIAGYAKQTSYISLIEATINIIGSVIMVNYFGITGVLVATVIALPLKVVYLNYIADIKIMKRSPIKTISILAVNYLVFISAILFRYFYDIEITSYVSFALYGLLFTTIFGIITIILNIIVNPDILPTLKLWRNRK